MALTTQQIHAVADELHEEGIKPTLANVRKRLGGGSFTTISDAMQSWRKEHKEEQQLQQVELPTTISDRLQALGADLWQTAIDIANDRLSKERDALEVIKAKAQQDVDEYAESVKTLESEQKELLQQLDELNDIANTAIAERDKLKEQLADKQHKLELTNTATDTAQRQLDDTRTALDKAQAELTDKTSQVATLTANNNSKQSEIDRLKSELEASQSEIKELKAEVKTLNKEHNELNAQYAENKGELKAVKQERDNLATANDKLKATQQTAKKSLL